MSTKIYLFTQKYKMLQMSAMHQAKEPMICATFKVHKMVAMLSLRQEHLYLTQ
nr:hypothetical protein [Enterococcus sp. DIV2402]